MLIFVCGLYSQEKSEAERIVDIQLEAYNNRDIDAFMETYHDSIKTYNFPGKLDVVGKAQLRARYGGMFERMKKLHAISKERMVLRNIVIDLEEANFYLSNTEKPDRTLLVFVTYVIKDGIIWKVEFTQ